MKIRFTQSGGFAGLTKYCELDTETMVKSEADKLEELLNESKLSQTTSLKTKSRDGFNYEIMVENEGRVSSLTVAESALPEAAIPLIEFLSSHSTIRKSG